MKKIKKFQWLMMAVCLFVVSNVSVMAEGEGETQPRPVPIPLVNEDFIQEGDYRTDTAIPFTAYYQNETIYISTMGKFTTLAVSVVNETTGQEWDVTMDISDGMGEISIAGGGAGGYTVEIVTEYNECFTGGFVQQH